MSCQEAVAVVVRSAFTGVPVCNLKAHSVPDLKSLVEEASSIHRSEQYLIMNEDTLQDGLELAAQTSPAPVDGLKLSAGAGSAPVAITMVRLRTLAGAVWRALRRVGDGDVESAVNGIRGELVELGAQNVVEFEAAAAAVIEKALSTPWHSEGCAEVALCIHDGCAPALTGHGGESADAFRRALKGLCQAKYQDLVSAFDAYLTVEEMPEAEAKLPQLMRFCAHLFARNLLPFVTLRVMANNLICEEMPGDYLVESACALFEIAGPPMGKRSQGRPFVTEIVYRLSDLKKNPDATSEWPGYERLAERIESLMEL